MLLKLPQYTSAPAHTGTTLSAKRTRKNLTPPSHGQFRTRAEVRLAGTTQPALIKVVPDLQSQETPLTLVAIATAGSPDCDPISAAS